MRRLKNAMVFLVTLGLLAVGAGLPRLVAVATDRNHLDQPGTREMQSIDLDLSGERRELSVGGKIDLLRHCQIIDITEKEATMTVAEVNAAAEAAMAEYVDAGIFQWFDITSWTSQPKLCIDPDAPDNYGIFWMVTVINELKPYQSLGIDIDDETGTVYSIRYDLYGEYSLDGVWERNYSTMDAVSHVYLNQLGLLEQNMEPNIEYGELDGEVLCGRFFFKDDDFGKIGIEFYVTGTGSFWVYFTE